MEIEIKKQSNSNFSSNRFWNRISEQLSPLLDGHELSEWIENIGNRLYLDSLQDSINIDLKKYYILTNIEKSIYRKDLSVNARLVQNEDSFIIELKDLGSNNNIRLQKYYVAHEIAHTFFFDTSSKPYRDYKLFSYGSKELEFICNRIARAILLPSCTIKRSVNNLISNPCQKDFSLSKITELSNRFGITKDILLNRLIIDTGIWNCLIISFTLHEELKAEKKIYKWRMKKDYLPYHYWGNLRAFIPKSPTSAKRDTENLLNTVFNELINIETQGIKLNKTNCLCKTIKKEVLLNAPFKNFVNYHFENSEEILVHFSAGLYYSSKNDSLKTIDVCIPFS